MKLKKVKNYKFRKLNDKSLTVTCSGARANPKGKRKTINSSKLLLRRPQNGRVQIYCALPTVCYGTPSSSLSPSKPSTGAGGTSPIQQGKTENRPHSDRPTNSPSFPNWHGSDKSDAPLAQFRLDLICSHYHSRMSSAEML
ncbi:hypothetical protein ACLOJK_031927 [Asimina triloba]